MNLIQGEKWIISNYFGQPPQGGKSCSPLSEAEIIKEYLQNIKKNVSMPSCFKDRDQYSVVWKSRRLIYNLPLQAVNKIKDDRFLHSVPSAFCGFSLHSTPLLLSVGLTRKNKFQN